MEAKKRILVVDDDHEVLELLEDLLTRQEYSITTADCAEEMWKKLDSSDDQQPFDLILLDVKLPDGDGIRLAQKLTQKNYSIPIMLMTAQGSEEDHILGLEFGADDYIEKPFNLRTLNARLNVILKRHHSSDASAKTNNKEAITNTSHIYHFLGWELDTKKHTLTNPKGSDVAITKGVFDILVMLIEKRDRALSREYLSEATKTSGVESFERAVDAQIARLRRFIEDDPNDPQIIKTVRGVGYTFAAPLDNKK